MGGGRRRPIDRSPGTGHMQSVRMGHGRRSGQAKEGQGAGTVSTEATEAAEDGGEHAEAEGEQRPVGAAQWRWSEQLFASFLSLPMTDVIVNESGKDGRRDADECPDRMDQWDGEGGGRTGRTAGSGHENKITTSKGR